MKIFSIVLLFLSDNPFVHECSANFSLFFGHFRRSFIKTAKNHKCSLKCVIFCHLEYFSSFCEQNFVQGGTFNFWPIVMSHHKDDVTSSD